MTDKENKMKEVVVVGYEDIGFEFSLCDELYEDGCGQDIEGRFLDVEFLKIMFESRLEHEEDTSKIDKIDDMLVSIKDLNNEVLVEF